MPTLRATAPEILLGLVTDAVSGLAAAEALALIHGELAIELCTATSPPASTSPLRSSPSALLSPIRATVRLVSTTTEIPPAASKALSSLGMLVSGGPLVIFACSLGSKTSEMKPETGDVRLDLVSSRRSPFELLPVPAWAIVPMVTDGITNSFLTGTMS